MADEDGEEFTAPLHLLLSFDAEQDPDGSRQALADFMSRATENHSGHVSYSITLESPVPRSDSDVQTSRTCTPRAAGTKYGQSSYAKAEDLRDAVIQWSKSNPSSKSNSRTNSQMKPSSSVQGSISASELNAKLFATFKVPATPDNQSTQSCVQATELDLPELPDDCHVFDGLDVDFVFGNSDPIPAHETVIRYHDLGNGQQQLSIHPTTASAREAMQFHFDSVQLVRRTMRQARDAQQQDACMQDAPCACRHQL
jgi:hypothetical protein